MKYFSVIFLNEFEDEGNLFTCELELESYTKFTDFIDSMINTKIILKNKTYKIEYYVINYQKSSFDKDLKNFTIVIYCSRIELPYKKKII